MKTAVIITVRSDSKRLPGKALLSMLDRKVIELVVLRAKLVKNADAVIVCTTERSIDDPIVAIAEQCKVQYFRGSTEDKLARWLGAIKAFDIDGFVTMDGDDLLCDPELLELGIEQLKAGKGEFIEAPDGLIVGSFTYAIKADSLEKACAIKGTADTEMMWVYFKDTGLFDVRDLKVVDKIFFDSNIRMTLDYMEDFEFFSAIFNHFGCSENDVSLREIIPFLQQNPQIIELNAFRHKDWAENQKNKSKLVLKKKSEDEV